MPCLGGDVAEEIATQPGDDLLTCALDVPVAGEHTHHGVGGV
jgi:hypothetical protein